MCKYGTAVSFYGQVGQAYDMANQNILQTDQQVHKHHVHRCLISTIVDPAVGWTDKPFWNFPMMPLWSLSDYHIYLGTLYAFRLSIS